LAPDAIFCVAGGESRQQSSQIGARAVPLEYDTVLVHDAARPFVTPTLIGRVIKGVEQVGAAFPAVPQTDTVKIGSGDKWVTPDRTSVVAVQTPQGSRREPLLRAFSECHGEFTDEASMLESLGIPVLAVEGDPANIKVTHPADVSRILTNVETRTGMGYDVHAFSDDPDRPLWLGGVEFDDRPGLEGHSDADVLLHAVVDALLGAACLGDIGLRYPNTDLRWKNASSSLFLRETAALLSENGWTIGHIDATVLAERPKVMVRREEICSTIADLAGIGTGQVSVKATTNEGLGAIGRGEGIAAMAVATVTRTGA
jgi:2-C-methyl-D-erythritol 4-phosphate cytidylyltransferase/2-C-methyl-D-erythritol 2,4-cyclodiphosphate synthase